MSWVSYNYAVLRVVPRVHLHAFVNVGVIVHARTAGFLAARLLADPADLAARIPGADADLLSRYLLSWRGISEGRPECGPVALAPPSERFHWLTAPRSDILQSSPVHAGLCEDPERVLEEMFGAYVARGPHPAA